MKIIHGKILLLALISLLLILSLSFAPTLFSMPSSRLPNRNHLRASLLSTLEHGTAGA